MEKITQDYVNLDSSCILHQTSVLSSTPMVPLCIPLQVYPSGRCFCPLMSCHLQTGIKLIQDLILGHRKKRPYSHVYVFTSLRENFAIYENSSLTRIMNSIWLSMWSFRFSKRNMLLWGIWQGKGKPPFNAFFEPFTTQMNKLYKEGKCWLNL